MSRRRHLMSYQEYLAGGAEEGAAAEVAAMTEASGGAWKAISVGVATGVLTLLINRWLERVLK